MRRGQSTFRGCKEPCPNHAAISYAITPKLALEPAAARPDREAKPAIAEFSGTVTAKGSGLRDRITKPWGQVLTTNNTRRIHQDLNIKGRNPPRLFGTNCPKSSKGEKKATESEKGTVYFPWLQRAVPKSRSNFLRDNAKTRPAVRSGLASGAGVDQSRYPLVHVIVNASGRLLVELAKLAGVGFGVLNRPGQGHFSRLCRNTPFPCLDEGAPGRPRPGSSPPCLQGRARSADAVRKP